MKKPKDDFSYFELEFGSVPLLRESRNFLTMEGLARAREGTAANYEVREGGKMLIRSKISAASNSRPRRQKSNHAVMDPFPYTMVRFEATVAIKR